MSELPAWSLVDARAESILLDSPFAGPVTPEWAWGGSTGAGVRVCIVDSGVDGDHPLVGGVAEAVAVDLDDDDRAVISADESGDACGHGTACAGIVRSLAPDCSLHSVRVLGAGMTGRAAQLVAGLEWAVAQGYEVVNMSLSTSKPAVLGALHELADRAYFQGTVLVCSAHNLAVESYPWRFASVISVGSHAEPDAMALYANGAPPVEFFARGVAVDVAWAGGTTMRTTGNSFATPHVAGICARVLGKHPRLTPHQLKTVLHLTAANVRSNHG